MADTYAYRCEGGCDFQFASEARSQVRRQAREHRQKQHGENPPDPWQIDQLTTRNVG